MEIKNSETGEKGEKGEKNGEWLMGKRW